MTQNIYKDLTQLGSETNMPSNPDDAFLEKVKNPNYGDDYMVRFTCRIYFFVSNDIAT